MPTQLDHTWLPIMEKSINTDLYGGLDQTAKVSREVKNILGKLEDRRYRGIQTIPAIKKLNDSHSSLSSDDLLWFIRGMTQDELHILESVKIKGEQITIPRELSHRILGIIKITFS